jgi:hypothetical protein
LSGTCRSKQVLLARFAAGVAADEDRFIFEKGVAKKMKIKIKNMFYYTRDKVSFCVEEKGFTIS